MGVYYKDVNMPVDCIVCPFGWNGCNKQHDFVYMGSRPDNCPLVEVPTPHGDLIERDKLREKEFIHDGDAYAVVMSRDIRNAPTIIPADDKDINVPVREECE